MHPVIDLHCDLLAYLGRQSGRTLHEPQLGCALPYLQQGHVKVQVCAIFTDVVPESPQQALHQAQIFEQLPGQYPGELIHATANGSWAEALEKEPITIIAAIEGATGICNEQQPLAEGIRQLDALLAHTGPLAYMSLTHHKRNRFGGGNYEPGPLTDDGKVLIDAMAERKIPLDLSHSSDALAISALQYIDQKGYNLPVLASHSNYRAVLDEPRNLPDYLVHEINRRGGVVGLNVLRKFMHPTDPEGLYRHVAHAHAIHLLHVVAFGADYFYTLDMPEEARAIRDPFYLEPHADARCYPALLAELENRYPEEWCQGIAHRNALGFLERAVAL